jgi:hypothetical protein
MRKIFQAEAPNVKFVEGDGRRLWRCIELFSDATIMLEMDKAVAVENYERAIVFRDELSRRKHLRETKFFNSGSQQTT